MKYISNRVKVNSHSSLSTDRYKYLALNESEPNLGLPGEKPLPLSSKYYNLITIEGGTLSDRYWREIPPLSFTGGISIFDEGFLVGSANSVSKINFVGAAISATASGDISTIRVYAPGSSGQIIFNNTNDFSTDSLFVFNPISNSLGIGTTNALANLHVQGSFKLTESLADYYNNVGAAGSILISTGIGVSWSAPFAAGLQGIQGVQGVQGVQGATGTQGIQGIQGVQGRQGIQGVQGRQGIQGITGSQGTSGTQGTIGTQGITGTQGIQGVQGTQGITGAQGTQGIQGIQGVQGITGPGTNVIATADTTDANQFPVFVAAAGSNQTPRVSAQFIINPNSNRVGIGTTNPQKSLHIAGVGTQSGGIRLGNLDFFAFGEDLNASGSPTFRNSQTNGSTVLRVLPNGTGNAQFEFFGKDYYADINAWDNFRVFATGTSYRIDTSFGTTGIIRPIILETGVSSAGISTNPNQLYLSTNGNIGIGTSIPVGQLQVSSGPVIIGAATSTGTATQPLQVTGGAYVSGNLGIGTTNPDKPLHIYTADGDIRLGDITEGTSTTDAGVIFTGLGTITSALFTEVNGEILSYAINTDQIIGIQTARAGGIFRLDARTSGGFGNANCFVVKARPIGTTTEYNALVVGLNDGSTYLSPVRGNVLVGTSVSTGTASQPLQVTGGAYVSGNLGIGTTNPTSKLHVVGDARITGVITATTFIGALTGNVTGNVVGNINSSGVSTITTLSGTTLTYTNVNSTNTVLSGITTVSNTVVPNANNTVSLGTSATRWANVFSNDLDLSNEGSANSIDGTWGSFLVQEGEEHLYIINRRSGKKFRFVLEEV
jgi:hypothetical protein